MKSPLFSVFIVASAVVAIAHCFPGPVRNDDTSESFGNDELDTVLVLPGHRNPIMIPRPIVRVPYLGGFDDDSLEDFKPFSLNPFGGKTFDDFLGGLNGVINRLKEQMAGMLAGIPGPSGFGLGGRIPEGGNTTSTTKIIDGHVVTINETTYQSDNDGANIVYRIHTVVVNPVNETAGGDGGAEVDGGGGEEIEIVTSGVTDNPPTEQPTILPDRSVETVEDLTGNSIPSKNDVNSLNA